MRRNVFIFHGTAGYPEENWFPWLKHKLEAEGDQVFVPQFPMPEGQSAEAWFKILATYSDRINEQTVFVGHSLGGLFLLCVLEKLETPCALAAFVGTPIGEKPILNYERDGAFCGFSFDWNKIKNNARQRIVFHSDNDPYVGLENGKKLANHLGVKLNFVPQAGHFNKAAGYTQFEELYALLKSHA